MKQCNTCEQVKDLSGYGPHSTTSDRLNPKCRACVSAYNAAYRAKNAVKIREQDRLYSEANADHKRTVTREWIKANPDRKKQHDQNRYTRFKTQGRLDLYYGNVDKERNKMRAKLWRQMNQGQVNATLAKRRAAVLKATPPWAEYQAMIDLYKQARQMTETLGTDYEVDHIVPLNGELVCGLHCIANLQILTAKENNEKRNSFST